MKRKDIVKIKRKKANFEKNTDVNLSKKGLFTEFFFILEKGLEFSSLQLETSIF